MLMISPTCSNLRRMLLTAFSKPTVYNTVTFNTEVFLIPVYRPSLDSTSRLDIRVVRTDP